MQKTSNYNLKKPEPGDPLRVVDFNENADIVDAALAGKAEQSAVTAVETALASKADTSAITAVESALANKADASALAALSTALEGKGNCRIATGNYVGTGTYGAANPVVLTFDFAPKMVVVAEEASIFYPVIVLHGTTRIKMANGYSSVVRSGTSVGWYHESSAENQFNYSGKVYCYIALG